MRYRDRAAAGRELAGLLDHQWERRPVVVGLPRGGVPVAAEVAALLGTELDVVLVRKIGAPDRPELAVGAIGEDGVTVKNEAVLRELDLTWSDLSAQVRTERATIRDQAVSLRPSGVRPDLRGRSVILVDDGIATGATAVAALQVLRTLGARDVVLAVPVAPRETLRILAPLADEIVCPLVPADFSAVGQFYRDFTQVPDDEVRKLLG